MGERQFQKVMEISNQFDLDNCEVADWTALNVDSTTIALNTSHKTGAYSIGFNKDGTTLTTGGIYKTIGGPNGKNGNIFATHKIKLNVYISATTNISSISLLLGTDSSHHNVYTETSLSSGWNELEFEADAETSVTGNGCDWYSIKYVAVYLTFGAAANTLTGILVDTIYLYKANISGEVADDVNIRQLGGVNIPTDDSAMPATPKVMPIAGEYRASPTTYTDGDATVLQTNVNGELKVAMSSDIEIGAVELKNGATDDRALISDANTARTIADHVLSTQNIGADGTVAPTGSLNSNAPFSKITDGTSDLILGTGTVKTVPSEIHDGTTGVIVETDGTKKALNVNVTDGTNDQPTMDANTRAGYQKITDGTNEVDIIATVNSMKEDISSIGGEVVVADNGAGASVTKTLPVGGKYNAAAPTYTDGDVVMNQYDINGNLLVNSDGLANAPQAYGLDVAGADAYATVVTAGAERHHISISLQGSYDAIISLDSGTTDHLYIPANSTLTLDNVLIENGATVQGKNAGAGENYTKLAITIW